MEGNGAAREEVAARVVGTGGELAGRAGDTTLENALLEEGEAPVNVAGKDPPEMVARLVRKGLEERGAVVDEEVFVDPLRTDAGQGVVKENGDGLGAGDVGEHGFDLVFGKMAVGPFVRRHLSVHDKKLHLLGRPPGETVTESLFALGDEELVRGERQGRPHHRDVVVVARGVVDGGLQIRKDLGGELVGGLVRVVGDVTGVDDEVGGEGQRIDRRDEGLGARAGIRPANGVRPVGAKVGVADVDDLEHGEERIARRPALASEKSPRPPPAGFPGPGFGARIGSMSDSLALSIWLAVAAWAAVTAAGLAGWTLPGARWIWGGAWVAFVFHAVTAFATRYQWSQEIALAETARQTRELVGLESGAGLWWNYAFGLFWGLDLARWFATGEEVPSGDVARRLHRALRIFLAFMVFNGAVIFVEGPQRGMGLAVFAVLAVAWGLGRMRRRRGWGRAD